NKNIMKVLNLYAGLGGNRKLWPESYSVTAIENNQKIADEYKRMYPNDTVIVGDAHQYLLDNFRDFDFIWSSPPCQSHSKMQKATRHKSKQFPDMNLYQEIILLQNFFNGGWVVENVVPYYKPLIDPTQKISRHLFWANFPISNFEIKQPKGFINKSNMEAKKELMDWLGIQIDKNIYYAGNHCPSQILRNCVHPLMGQH